MRKFYGIGLLFFSLLFVSCGGGSKLSTVSTSSGVKRSRYPLVLAHGTMSIDSPDIATYYYGVPEMLRAAGYTVYTPLVSGVNNSAVRGRELAAQIDQILKETGAAKVNIIAHSMGGTDARYVVSSLGYGDRVASVTTISTDHHGSKLADIAYFLLGGQREVGEMFTTLMGVGPDTDTSAPKYKKYGVIDYNQALYSLTTEFMEKHFNPDNPDDARVFYQSWSGHAPLVGINNPDWIAVMMRTGYDLLMQLDGDNDGMVSVSSARHGQDNGSFPAHHLDEVGQLLGHQSYGFDYRRFYQDLADGLAKKGF